MNQLLEFRYTHALNQQDEFADDSAIVEFLDFYLENWLYFKEQCPVCGGAPDEQD